MAPRNKDLFDILDFNNLFTILIKNWYWFLISVIISLAGAVFYLKISPKVYEVNASVIKNEGVNSAQKASEQLLNDNIRFISEPERWGRGNNLENEILVLKSTSYIEKAIQGVDLQITYYEHDRFRDKELYKSSPFLVILKPDYPQPVGCKFTVNILSDQEYEISIDEKDAVYIYNLTKKQGIKELPSLSFRHKGKFDKALLTENMNFKLLLNSNYNLEELKGKTYSFTINTQQALVSMLQWQIEIFPMSNNILWFNMETMVPQKAIDILSNLTNYYAQNELNKKLEMSDKAIEYINGQLYSIQSSLKVAEAKLQRYQSSNELTDITRQSGQMFEEISRLESEKAIIEINLRYYKYIDDYLKAKSNFELLAPSAMGIEDDLLNSLVTELISLKAEKLSLIENNQDKSPYLRQINIRIENLQKMISENIAYYTKNNSITLKDINARINNLNQKASELPKTQRELLGYERQYEINDKLFAYLMQKKAEAEIAKASIQGEVDILEPASTSPFPVAPKKNVILFAALILGILVPMGIIQFLEILRRTFATEEEIRDCFEFPVLGKVYRNNLKGKKGDLPPQPHVLESFRKLHTKFDYFIPGSRSKVISISSTISQEGKSFISKNLAITLASSHLNTVLLGFDLRKPKIYDNLGLADTYGITDFLAGRVGIDEIIQKSNIPNLDVIIAGQKPPNPTALISSPITETLFEQLRNQYDYIIVDTPPIGIVTDGFPLIRMSDLLLYVVRIKRSLIKETNAIIDELEEQNPKNVALVINDVPVDKKGRYGYGYYGEK